MLLCWGTNPYDRPTLAEIDKALDVPPLPLTSALSQDVEEMKNMVHHAFNLDAVQAKLDALSRVSSAHFCNARLDADERSASPPTLRMICAHRPYDTWWIYVSVRSTCPPCIELIPSSFRMVLPRRSERPFPISLAVVWTSGL